MPSHLKMSLLQRAYTVLVRSPKRAIDTLARANNQAKKRIAMDAIWFAMHMSEEEGDRMEAYLLTKGYEKI